MSKPLNEEIFVGLENNLVKRKKEVLFQVLDLLENFKSNNEKMVRISSGLTEILDNEENLERILNAKNLEELLSILTTLNEDKMIKVYENSYLKEKFPHAVVDEFLK